MVGSDDEQCPSQSKVFAVVVVLSTGLGLGLSVPDLKKHESPTLDLTSSVLGWLYFSVWSISFYPQLYLNWRRRSVVGLSFDFLLLNFIGFVAYSIFNWALLLNTDIQQEYSKRSGGHENVVKINDAVFATHGAAITAVTIAQCFMYDRDGQQVSSLVKWASSTVVCISMVSLAAIKLSLLPKSIELTVLEWLYWLSFVKLAVTVAKYIPQVLLNYRRQSTQGWNIYNVLCDFTGGILSLAQLFVDVSIQGSWAGVIGDPVKFGLGFSSLLFDVVFMTQHFCLYRHSRAQSWTKRSDDDGREDRIPLTTDVPDEQESLS